MIKLMWPALGLTALGVLFMGAVANRASALPLSSAESLTASEASHCPIHFEGFRQAVTWYRGSHRILVEARSGCTSRIGTVLTLEGVKLTFQKGNHVTRVIESPEGQIALKQQILQIADASLLLNLKTGELRAPGTRVFLGGKR
jgi:hypothetical protein